jgi:hypothetical protein
VSRRQLGLGQCECLRFVLYNTLLRFWPARDLAELADGPTGRGEVAFLCLRLQCDKVNCTYEGAENTWRCRFISDSLLGYNMKIPTAEIHALHYKCTVLATLPVLTKIRYNTLPPS